MSPVDERETPGDTRRGGVAAAAAESVGRVSGVRPCRLGEVAGRSFVCGDACAFWETGGAVLPAGCLLERVPLDLRRRPDSARRLVELKERLETVLSERDRRTAAAELARLVDRAVDGAAVRR